MRPKIYLITDTGWWDTDLTVLPYLSPFFDLEVNLIASTDNNKFSDKSISDFKEKYTIPVTIRKRINRIRNPLNLFIYLKMYFEILLKKGDNSIIHYVYTYDPYINLIMLLFKPSKMVVSIHDYEEHVGLRNKLRTTFKDMIIKRARFFHFFSENELSKFLLDHPEKKAFYTPMPLKHFGDLLTYQAIPFERGKGKKVLLFFGFIRYYKGLDILIKALSELKRRDYLLVIAGAADDWNIYKDKVAGNNNILSHNFFINDEQIGAYFKGSDFLVLPYRNATQSGPALIAINYNLPIIASNLKCFTNLIDQDIDGFLFEKENVLALCNALEKALDLTDAEYIKMKGRQKEKMQFYKNAELNVGDVFSSFMKENILTEE